MKEVNFQAKHNGSQVGIVCTNSKCSTFPIRFIGEDNRQLGGSQIKTT